MPSGFLNRSAFNLSTMVFQKLFKFSLFSTKVMLITAWSSMSTQHLHDFKFTLIESDTPPAGEFLSDAPFFHFNWQTAHARMAGVEPLNLKAN